MSLSGAFTGVEFLDRTNDDLVARHLKGRVAFVVHLFHHPRGVFGNAGGSRRPFGIGRRVSNFSGHILVASNFDLFAGEKVLQHPATGKVALESAARACRIMP